MLCSKYKCSAIKIDKYIEKFDYNQSVTKL